jgi:predicted transcriptional regulator
MRGAQDMTLTEIQKILDAVTLSKNTDGTLNILSAYGADLMSDVLAFSIADSLLITHLTNTQVIHTADIAEIKAIVFVQGKRPDMEIIALADAKKIPLMVTGFSMFDSCGRLYERGLRSGGGPGP